MVQDLTTYTEVDSNSDLTISTSTVDFALMQRDADAHLSYDFGAGYFEDFSIDFEYEITFSQSDSLAFIGLGNVAGHFQDLLDDASGIVCGLDNSAFNLRLYVQSIGSSTDTDNLGGSTEPLTYATFERVGTTLTLTAYSDANRTIQIGQAQVTSVETSFRYFMAVMNRGSTSETASITGYFRNFDIQLPFSKYDNIEISESVSMLRGLSGSLPIFTDDLTISESVEIERGFSGELSQSEEIEISEQTSLVLSFSGELVEAENIAISLFRNVELEGPTISVFESITLWESGNIRPEIFSSDDINLSEYVLTRRGYWADVDDTVTFTDTFDVFHYSNWLRQNAAKSKQRFFFTLTGSADSTTDIEIPSSSIFARKRSDDPTYLQVTIPSFNYSGDIAIRPSGEMLVDMGYEIDGVIELRERILEADIEDISTYEGPLNRSIVLTGHRTQSLGGQLVTFDAGQVIYRGYQTRARAFRFAFIDPFLNPGDTVVVGQESFTCNNIIYTIQPTRTVMEVREAL